VHRYPTLNSWTLNGTQSDWSKTQTITMPESSSSNYVSADLAVTLVLIGVGVVLVVTSLFFFLRRKQEQKFHH
jgi:LPXTG-motif cell wall-anchored protein